MNNKLTPKDRKSIIVRVRQGEKQVDLAKEYGVSKGYISKIVNGSRKPTHAEPSKKPADFTAWNTEQLNNRFKQCHSELYKLNRDLVSREHEAEELRTRIMAESEKSTERRDADWLLAQQKRLAWCEDASNILFQMALLYQEISGILHVLSKRNLPIPCEVSISLFKT